MKPYRGHDVDWRHYQAPRTAPGFYTEQENRGDVWVFRVCALLLAGLVAALLIGWV